MKKKKEKEEIRSSWMKRSTSNFQIFGDKDYILHSSNSLVPIRNEKRKEINNVYDSLDSTKIIHGKEFVSRKSNKCLSFFGKEVSRIDRERIFSDPDRREQQQSYSSFRNS